jgi:DNA-binding PadR family transcriptional regulator
MIVLQEPAYLILTAFTRGPVHGYGAMQIVSELSDGRVIVRPGTLYTALDRFLNDGWIEVDEEELVDGRMRRTYRLTDAGATVLADEADRLASNARIAKRGLAAHLRTKRA